MATTVTSNYDGDDIKGYLHNAMLQSDTLGKGLVTVFENVKYKRAMKLMNSSNILQGDSCDFDAQGDLSIAERYLEPTRLKVNAKQCLTTFIESYAALDMGASASDNWSTEVMDAIVKEYGASIGQSLEQMVWTGVAGVNSFDGFETLLAAATTAAHGEAAEAIDDANVLPKLKAVVNAIPQALLGKEDLTIFVAMNVLMAYRNALGGFGVAGYAPNAPIDLTSFNGIKMVGVQGMAADSIIAAQKANLAFGTGLLSDMNDIRILDQRQIDGSDNVHFVAKFSGCVQVAVPSEIVYYAS
jgi:hypothetical protein